MTGGQTNRPTVRVVETNHTLNLEVTAKIEKREAVIEPGAPKNYPDVKKLVTKDCIQL